MSYMTTQEEGRTNGGMSVRQSKDLTSHLSE